MAWKTGGLSDSLLILNSIIQRNFYVFLGSYKLMADCCRVNLATYNYSQLLRPRLNYKARVIIAPQS